MPQIELTISYRKNTNQVFSAADIKGLYFTGIELRDQFGNPIPDEQLDFYIQAAQKEIQDTLSVKLVRQAYKESKDFFFDDWLKWAYIPTSYPVVKAKKMQGFINSTLQVDYPEQWLSSKRQEGEEDVYHRTINLVPVTGSQNNTISGSAVFVGIAPFIGYFGNKQIPNYWEVTYLTGFNKVPADILNAIGKKASINIFTQLGDILFGGPGIANKSISIDGLSQSIGSTASAMYSLFSARIAQYEKDLDKAIPLLKDRYRGITFGVLG